MKSKYHKFKVSSEGKQDLFVVVQFSQPVIKDDIDMPDLAMDVDWWDLNSFHRLKDYGEWQLEYINASPKLSQDEVSLLEANTPLLMTQ